MTNAEFRAHLVAYMGDRGEPFAKSYFDRSLWTENPPQLQPWSFVADQRIKEFCRPLLRRHGVTLLQPKPAHMDGRTPPAWNWTQ